MFRTCPTSCWSSDRRDQRRVSSRPGPIQQKWVRNTWDFNIVVRCVDSASLAQRVLVALKVQSRGVGSLSAFGFANKDDLNGSV
jgi:hypothetical protein